MNKSVTYIVGATVLVGGAYLFLKNKKAKDLAKLDEIGGTTPSGTTPSGTTSGATTTGGTTSQNNEVFLPSDNDMKLLDATLILPKIKDLKAKLKMPFVGEQFDNLSLPREPWNYSQKYKWYREAQISIPKQIEKLVNDLDNLDYALDSNDKLVKLDPNRNKEWIKVQKLYLSLVSSSSLLFRQKEISELAKYGYKIDPITKKLIKI